MRWLRTVAGWVGGIALVIGFLAILQPMTRIDETMRRWIGDWVFELVEGTPPLHAEKMPGGWAIILGENTAAKVEGSKSTLVFRCKDGDVFDIFLSDKRGNAITRLQDGYPIAAAFAGQGGEGMAARGMIYQGRLYFTHTDDIPALSGLFIAADEVRLLAPIEQIQGAETFPAKGAEAALERMLMECKKPHGR